MALVNKKPAIDWAIAGSLEIYCYGLENPSHDANAASAALPHGRLSGDKLAVNANFNRDSHLLTAVINSLGNGLSSAGFQHASSLTAGDKTVNTWEVASGGTD